MPIIHSGGKRLDVPEEVNASTAGVWQEVLPTKMVEGADGTRCAIPEAGKVEWVECPDESGSHRVAVVRFDAVGESKGPPILMVHALTRNGGDFDVLAGVLAGHGRNVAVVDMPGRRLSERLSDPTKYGYPQYISDAGAIVKHLGWEEMDWVGTSMGGLLAMMVCALPETVRGYRIRRLVLNDVGPFVSAASLSKILTYVGSGALMANLKAASVFCQTRWSGFHPVTPRQWLRMAETMTRPVKSGEEGGGEGSEEVRELSYDIRIAHGLSAVCKEPEGPALTEETAAIPLPPLPLPEDKPVEDVDLTVLWDAMSAQRVLVIRGSESTILEEETAAKMVLGAEDTRTWVTIPEAGHAPSLYDAESCALITHFLSYSK